ncbi:MAG: signal recognition particle protein [Waddliaceae bacterium]|jgi:signal recognition particle subunit SRP54|nr:signal recognition particle protein [Waddliaceae bacterium]MBT3579184.1 signal recognition particle protein [Waddliaceae bacterium]MBT4444756.1 signal recognition particle protein [Waddliaceae bacterium]MBT6928884.1 signal recognition particle protein [Waddliaceae bacterium]MBT7264132.1 signal recognition particle protein [Waddliaceae bacterium]
MFGAVTEKFGSVFAAIAGKNKLSEDNITDAVRQVRLALLEADVNYSVTKNFIKRVKEKALGDAVMKSVKPGEQFIKVVHDELVALMGGEEPTIDVKGKPAVMMVCGLQGSGKTTQCAKIAHMLQGDEYKKRPLLVACDLQRPAAVEQLKTLGKHVGIDVFAIEGQKKPVKVAKEAVAYAKKNGHDVVIVDTAGRLHVDEELMEELAAIKKAITPNEVLFVANAATGQDAVTTAAEFDARVEMTGTILTMLDGNTRGGAAISITEVTKKPLKFEGIGENVEDLQIFNPESMADRILGMGDTINLVKKAQQHFDEKESGKLEEKLRKATFTYEDYLKQIQTVKKMGSLKSIMKMLPGMGAMKDVDIPEDEFRKVEAMILAMTKEERRGKVDLGISRRRRVARGSGTKIDDINRLRKSFKRAKQFFKNMPHNMKQLEKKMGGAV